MVRKATLQHFQLLLCTPLTGIFYILSCCDRFRQKWTESRWPSYWGLFSLKSRNQWNFESMSNRAGASKSRYTKARRHKKTDTRCCFGLMWEGQRQKYTGTSFIFIFRNVSFENSAGGISSCCSSSWLNSAASEGVSRPWQALDNYIFPFQHAESELSCFGSQ